jgi:hypothetical protein
MLEPFGTFWFQKGVKGSGTLCEALETVELPGGGADKRRSEGDKQSLGGGQFDNFPL